jgi:hypothetical protein
MSFTEDSLNLSEMLSVEDKAKLIKIREAYKDNAFYMSECRGYGCEYFDEKCHICSARPEHLF